MNLEIINLEYETYFSFLAQSENFEYIEMTFSI